MDYLSKAVMFLFDFHHKAKLEQQQIGWIIHEMVWWGLRPFGSFNLTSAISLADFNVVDTQLSLLSKTYVWCTKI